MMKKVEKKKWNGHIFGPAFIVFLILFEVWVSIYIISPLFLSDYGFYLTLYMKFGLFSTLTLFILLNQCDPGIIIPSINQDQIIELAEIQKIAGCSRITSGLFQDQLGQWCREFINFNGQNEIQKYCSTCHIWRDPNSSHCNICGFCFKRFDHHCPALAVCIAKNNIRFFIPFLILCGISCIIVGVSSLNAFPFVDRSNRKLIFFLIVLAIGSTIGGIYLIIFAFVHINMLLSNRTTKVSRLGKINQNKRWFHDLNDVFFSPIKWKYSTLYERTRRSIE
eukprot:c7151_g1_i1.p1 GENE.c7151_g1_i1~~c7151_g1_i1.p1  ORF type:complete len:290 (+),score=80.16 c7151_g1_i1:34-870(+)